MLSWATVRVMMQERDRSRFNHAKSTAELGISFRLVEETLIDEIAWFWANGILSAAATPAAPAKHLVAMAPR